MTLVMVHNYPLMEYFYTFGTFFHILGCSLLLGTLIPVSLLAPCGSCSTPLRWAALGITIAGIISLALKPVTPWLYMQKILHVFQLLTVPAGIVLAFSLVLSYRNKTIGDYSSWIVDTLRETVIIFDQDMRVISCGKPLLPDSWFPPGEKPGLPEIENSDSISRLRNSLELREAASGTLTYGNSRTYYRFTPMRLGYLLTFLDVSGETILLEELAEKNIQLENRSRSIQAMEETQLTTAKEQYRGTLFTQIHTAVRRNFIRLLAEIEKITAGTTSPGNAEIKQTLKHAEESMTAIRSMVRQLALEREDL